MKEMLTRYQGGVKETLNSLEVTEQINIFRSKEDNKSNLGHNDLLKVIRIEFDEEIAEGKISQCFYDTKYNKNLPMYKLTLNQSKQILMRESKFVRKAMIKYIENLEQALNKTMSIEDMIIGQAKSMKALRIEMEEVKDKVDNKMGLSGSQDYCIQNLVNKRVYSEAKKLFEVEELTVNIKKSIRPIFSEINKLIKIKFGISHRKDIPQSKYEEATKFINNWYISLETQLKVIDKFEELIK